MTRSNLALPSQGSNGMLQTQANSKPGTLNLTEKKTPTDKGATDFSVESLPVWSGGQGRH